MSDQWIFFPCQMGDHRASIFFDNGIGDSIDTAPRQLLKVIVAFKQPRPDGMSTNEEFQDLKALEDDLQVLVQQRQSVYVGRVTVDGHRHFYIYTAGSEAEWSSALDAFGQRHSYSLASVLKPDGDHDGYWQELFPTEDDWQVIQDLGVLEVLETDGDDGSASRCIDHWAFFPSQSAAEQFCEWAREHGYAVGSIDTRDDGQFRVRFSHEGTVRLADITSHTIALRRRANELGGNYDG